MLCMRRTPTWFQGHTNVGHRERPGHSSLWPIRCCASGSSFGPAAVLIKHHSKSKNRARSQETNRGSLYRPSYSARPLPNTGCHQRSLDIDERRPFCYPSRCGWTNHIGAGSLRCGTAVPNAHQRQLVRWLKLSWKCREYTCSFLFFYWVCCCVCVFPSMFSVCLKKAAKGARN